jgi:hypothetical protein
MALSTSASPRPPADAADAADADAAHIDGTRARTLIAAGARTSASS